MQPLGSVASRGGPSASLEFVNPLSGAPAVATFSNEMHRVYVGPRTQTTRKTGSSVFVVFRGRGRTVVNGMAIEWGSGDVFVTPSWASVDHQAYEQADLFAISDRPVLCGLHLYREEALPRHQEITGRFEDEGPSG